MTRLTDIKCIVQDGTPSTFVKETIDLIGAWLPFGITIGGKEVFSFMLKSKVGEEIMWLVAPLSIISLDGDEPEGTLALLTLGLADKDDALPCIIDNICWSCSSVNPLWIAIVASLESMWHYLLKIDYFHWA